MKERVRIDVFASGSSGNCALLRFGPTSILLDAGIGIRRIRRSLVEVECSLEELDAVLLTHEHNDHIKGLRHVVKYRPDLPLYATVGTRIGAFERGRLEVRAERIEPGTSFTIAGVDVLPFRVLHDASDPVGYRFRYRDVSVGWATDLGEVTDEVVESVRDADVLMVESNHDPELLRSGPYPAFLKQRVAGRFGHLANHAAAELVDAAATERTRFVRLLHLSDKNNEQTLAEQTVTRPLERWKRQAVACRRTEHTAPVELMANGELARPVQGALF